MKIIFLEVSAVTLLDLQHIFNIVVFNFLTRLIKVCGKDSMIQCMENVWPSLAAHRTQ